MFTDGRFYFPDERARLNVVEYEPPAEEPDEEYPYRLTTGRVVAQYLSGNQTRRIGYLSEQSAGPWLELHPSTAVAVGVVDGDPVRVTTRRASVILTAKVVRTIRADTVFIPYHWARPVAANQLTIPRFDPKSWIPAFKSCAVRLEKSSEPASPVSIPPVVGKDGRPETGTDPDAIAEIARGRASVGGGSSA